MAQVDRIGASHQKFHSSIAFSYYIQYFLHVQVSSSGPSALPVASCSLVPG